ncbi:4Fe-4S dicluster domain-containing protein [Candidatus Thorarchaeota archaeon]|nr:MAG: 4Fe-4S dicluster domain-containing protein [Candidatus Thorarchaeota archaeon]
MSHSIPEKTIAPKRQRMLDMVLALGGLKEESTIPISKVKDELENLKTQLAPLTDAIIAFPDSYFEEFLEVVKKSNIVAEITEQAILKEAISNLEQVLSIVESAPLKALKKILTDAVSRMTEIDKPQDISVEIDMTATISTILDLISEIESVTDEFEKVAETEAESARSELEALVEFLEKVKGKIETDPDAALEEFQKIGSKTRYGPGLRAIAQVKRGKREGRIDDTQYNKLVNENLLTETNRGVILFILGKMGSKTVVQIGNLMQTSHQTIQTALVTMIQRGEVEMVGLDGDTPVFSRVLTETPNSTLLMKRIVQQVRGIAKSLEGETAVTINKFLRRLQALLERLQILGAYNEPLLSESINKLRETVDSVTESVLTAKTSEDAENLKLLISAGLEAFTRFRLKITLEKGPTLVSGTNVYGEKLDPEVYKTMMDTYLDNELERGTILVLIRELGPLTAHDLTERTNIPSERILRHLLRMKRDELLTIAGENHGYLLYDVLRTPSEAEITIQTVSNTILQLTKARKELETILSDLKAEDIGKLTGSLEIFSRSRDILTKVSVHGSIIAELILSEVEEKIQSSVLLALRTRAKLPSTRPKVSLDDLADVDVPSVLEEYKSQMGYAPLLGFGTIEWTHSRCLSCKSCELDCPEDAIKLTPVLRIPEMFEFTDEALDELPINRGLLYKTVKSLATTKPTDNIVLEKESPGFGSVEVDLWLCVACRTCVRRCPGPADGALVLDLKWSLPEVVRQITSQM